MFFIFGNIFDACLEMVWRFEERTFYIGSLRCHWLRSKTYHIYLIPLWKLSLASETMEIHLILHLGQHMISSRRTGSHSRRCLNTEVITFFEFFYFFLTIEFHAQFMLQDILHPIAYFLQMMQLGRWRKLLLLLFTIKPVSQQYFQNVEMPYTLQSWSNM